MLPGNSFSKMAATLELNGQFQELSLEGTFAVLLLPIVLKRVFFFFFFGSIVNVLNLKDTQIH